jgi:hypothetical protein
VRDRIRLISTIPNYGGRRWLFVCPRTARRRSKLFLPRGGWHFWSREAYGVGYLCQRQGRLDRLERRAATLNLQLGGEGWRTWDKPPAKSKWMRWGTYERKIERWERVVEEAKEEYAIRVARLFGRT